MLNIVIIVLMIVLPLPLWAECRDYDAIDAANKKAESYYKESRIFHPAAVLKIHHPSRKKEVASYIKTGDKRYSVFFLIDHECKAAFIKRTRQQD
jgi:hypothetical protein|tara:strand:+ start:566 stop:850 length:285 start_codon:yes stop_codon:yes gene_type:complete